MRIVSDASLASARAVARRTLGPETFRLESRTSSDNAYGAEDSWSEVLAAMPARLSPETAQTVDESGRVFPVRTFKLIVPRTVAIKEGDRVTRNSDGKVFFVVGALGPQTDDAIVKTVRLQKEVKSA